MCISRAIHVLGHQWAWEIFYIHESRTCLAWCLRYFESVQVFHCDPLYWPVCDTNVTASNFSMDPLITVSSVANSHSSPGFLLPTSTALPARGFSACYDTFTWADLNSLKQCFSHINHTSHSTFCRVNHTLQRSTGIMFAFGAPLLATYWLRRAQATRALLSVVLRSCESMVLSWLLPRLLPEWWKARWMLIVVFLSSS